MPSAGIAVHPDCIEQFNELKMGKSGLRYIIYKISDDGKEIVVDETGKENDYEAFRTKLMAKQDPKSSGKIRPSYAVYDLRFEIVDEGPRTKIAFITYINLDKTAIRSRMVYASSREDLKSALNGIGMDHQAGDDEGIEYAELLKIAAKGKKVV